MPPAWDCLNNPVMFLVWLSALMTTVPAAAAAAAEAGVAVAMNAGTQAAEEAGNMVDLDSSPTGLIDAVRIGKVALDFLGLVTPQSATPSAIIYNVPFIVAPIPAALKGVKYREVSSGELPSRNLLVRGLGGLVALFALIKIIDLIPAVLGLA